MENKIAIAFDFSDVSKNAIKYALDSTKKDDILEIIHVDNAKIRIDSAEQIKSQIASQIKDYIKKEVPENLKITVLNGKTTNQLVTYIKKNIFDYLIIGTRDKYNIVERWIGSISLDIIKTLNIPVLLIPKFSFYKKYKKVIVASDYHLSNISILHQIKIWNKPFKAFVKFLHIKENDKKDYSEESQNIVKVLVEKEPVDFGFEISILNSKNISGSLLSVAYKFNADLLIIISENQTFMNKILFKSLSKEMIEKSSIPVLFLNA